MRRRLRAINLQRTVVSDAAAEPGSLPAALLGLGVQGIQGSECGTRCAGTVFLFTYLGML